MEHSVFDLRVCNRSRLNRTLGKRFFNFLDKKQEISLGKTLLEEKNAIL
jgi:hypothetical protein